MNTSATLGLMDAAKAATVRGLSYSGIADLAVSPLRYWHLHINPERPPDEPTPAQILGSALHCAVLEPREFESRYAPELHQVDYPEALVTMEDLRGWLRDKGFTPKGTRKVEVVAQVMSVAIECDCEVLIWDQMAQSHALTHTGKTMLSPEDWQRVSGMANALQAEPSLLLLLEHPQGRSEVAFTARDPETGVMLKARMDWITPTVTLDLKTFTVKGHKSVDRAVADAIYYEGYHHQAYFYSKIRALATGDSSRFGAQKAPRYVIAFVESDPPHEVRLRAISPKIGGREVSVLWEYARIECERLIALYAECVAKFGDRPWRTEQEIAPIDDLEIKGLAYS